jgi:hypothetical protein
MIRGGRNRADQTAFIPQASASSVELRQDAQRDVLGPDVDELQHLPDVRLDVPVREDHALGASGRARRVQDDPDVVVPGRRGADRLGDALERERVEPEEVPDGRGEAQVVEHGLDGDDRVGAAVGDDVLQFLALEQVVERDDGLAEHPGGEGRDGEGPAGGGHDADGGRVAAGADGPRRVHRGHDEIDAPVRPRVVHGDHPER